MPAEILETEHLIEIAEDSLYISKELSKNLLDHYGSLEKMLNSMINKSAAFCKQPVSNGRKSKE